MSLTDYAVTVESVLCIPSLTTNILPPSQLIAKGNIEDSYEKIYAENLVETAYLVNGGHKLNVHELTVSFNV